MADNVQVDGIKKMSDEEKQQSREIVLELIGEKEQKKQAEEKEVYKITNKKLDGVLATPMEQKPKPQVVTEAKKQEWKKEIAEIIPKEVKSEPKEIRPVETKRIEPKPEIKKHEPIELVAKPTAKIEKKPKVSFFQHLLENKKSEKTIIKKPEPPKPIIKKEVKPQVKRSIFAFDEKTKISWKKTEQTINYATRLALFYFFIFFILMLVVYLILILSVVKFKIDNSWLRSLSEKIVIPAIITKDGVIDYYQYEDMRAETNQSTTEAKETIVKNLIAGQLIKKLKLSTSNSPEAIARAMASNEEINRAPLERIRKIKQLVAGGEDFLETTAKFGDENGRITITKENEDNYSFSSEIKDIEKDKISDIIYAPEGYYILRCTDKNEDSQSFDYVYIRAKSLDSYLQEVMSNYKYISLVD